MTVYYKATHPDGTDFYTRTVNYAARAAARAAAGALIVKDLISTEQFNTLMRPWRILIGEES